MGDTMAPLTLKDIHSDIDTLPSALTLRFLRLANKPYEENEVHRRQAAWRAASEMWNKSHYYTLEDTVRETMDLFIGKEGYNERYDVVMVGFAAAGAFTLGQISEEDHEELTRIWRNVTGSIKRILQEGPLALTIAEDLAGNWTGSIEELTNTVCDLTRGTASEGVLSSSSRARYNTSHTTN
jgi:hypothetical protein